MDNQRTFMDDWHAGTATPDDIDKHIEAWHGNSGDHRTLHTALGMTWPQMRHWVQTGQLPAADPTQAPTPPPKRPRLNTRALYADVNHRRQRLNLSWRGLGKRVGMSSHSPLHRLGQGHLLSVEHIAALLLFLGHTDLAPYLEDDEHEQ